jgi:uncharacterized membrane protein YqjE
MSDRPESELVDTARRLWASVLEGVHLRVELLALEVGEERKRLVELVLSALIAVFAGFMVVLSVNVVLLVLFWDTHRVGAAVAMCAFYALTALAAAAYHRSRSRRTVPPFAATADVLARDEQALREPL